MDPEILGIIFVIIITIILIAVFLKSPKTAEKKSSLSSQTSLSIALSSTPSTTSSSAASETTIVSSPPANAIISTPTPTPTSTLVSTCSSASASCNNVLETTNYKLSMQSDGNLVLYKKSDNTIVWMSQTANKGTGPYRLSMQPDGNLVTYDSKNAPIWASGTYGRGTAPYKLIVLDSGSVIVSDSRDNGLWASNTASTSIDAKDVSIIAKIPVDSSPSVISSKLEQFVKYEKLDRGGDDISCLQGGESADFCSMTCADDPNCNAFNFIPTGTEVWGGKGGCCFKRSAAPLGDSQYITFYVRKRADKCHSTTLEASCDNTIETADYKLLMQPDGNLVLYKKSDNSVIWASQTFGKGVGPYRMTMQPDANLVVYDSKNAPIWASNTYGKGVGPYTVSLSNDGYFSVKDRSGAVLWRSDSKDDVIAAIGSVLAAPAAIITSVIEEIANLIPPPKKLGEECKLHTDCEGYMPLQNTLTCGGDGKCAQAQKDYSGIWYAPQDCRDAPAPLGQLGSCGSGNSWPRKAGQTCDTHFACEGYVALQNTLTCGGDNKCTQAKRDWAGVYYPPQDCVGAPFGQKGTC